ncbi:odorant receptor 67a-like [Drosophila eugracilis]|uniref:odorant receptor 67a-like n=1 Tax=Drosophila eugracilis TaxID=29029 RepID=UPI001BDACEE5|nr:odorant receptor 67a-like [Drosophila eugracilis]
MAIAILIIVSVIITRAGILFALDFQSSFRRSFNNRIPSPQQKLHQEYAVSDYLKRSHWITKGFGGLYPIQYTILKMLDSPSAKQSMPYFMLAPWDYHDDWKFYFTYMSQAIARYTATFGHINIDIMIFAVTVQATMHFDPLSRALREFKVRERGSVKRI